MKEDSIIQRTLGRIEGSLEKMRDDINESKGYNKETRDYLFKLESGRLTKLENDFMIFKVQTTDTAKVAVDRARKKAIWMGIFTGAGVSIIVSVISPLIVHQFIK